MYNKSSEYSIKVATAGDFKTGKSFLISNFFGKEKNRGNKDAAYNFKSRQYDYHERRFSLNFMDISGDPKHKSLDEIYYKDKEYIVLVFDANQRSSFDSLGDWLRRLKKVNPNAKILLFANNLEKNDSTVTKDEVNKLVKNNDLNLFTNQDIDDILKFICLDKLKKEGQDHFTYSNKTKKVLNNLSQNYTTETVKKIVNIFNNYQYDKDKKISPKENIELQKLISSLQYVSIIKSLENIITNALLLVFIFVTFPFINNLYKNNEKKHGDPYLFWTNSAKQAAEEVANLVQRDLEAQNIQNDSPKKS